MPCIEEIKELSDSQLYKLCREYGLLARTWRRKFAGLLPEVQRRRLYRKRGCTSIYEFAAKLGGLSQSTVNKILHLYGRLADKPHLLEQLVSGTVGWSKLEKVANIADVTSDKLWSIKTQNLNARQLEHTVREVRKTGSHVRVADSRGDDTMELDFKQVGEYKESFMDEGMQAEKRNRLNFPINLEVEVRLEQFKQSMEETRKEVVTYSSGSSPSKTVFAQ